MPRARCLPRIQPPTIAIPSFEPSPQERRHFKAVAADLAQTFLSAAEQTEKAADPCTILGSASHKMGRMTRRGRRAALRMAKVVADQRDKPRGGSGKTGGSLGQLTREVARNRLDELRPQFQSAIKSVAAQFQEHEYYIPKTTLRAGIGGEATIIDSSYLCVGSPTNLEFKWESYEPEVKRVYWELRGPLTNGYPGKFIAKGYSDGAADGPIVKGWFEINLTHYLGFQTPSPTERYYVKVLPLAAPEGLFVNYGVHTNLGLSTVPTDPTPPVGVGPWSVPVTIDIGDECLGPIIPIDIEEFDFYRKLRTRVNWFRVLTDQTGPGDEEYHFRCIALETSPQGIVGTGTFGTYLPIEEGDTSKHPINWKSHFSHLGYPIGTGWPKTFFLVLAVLEEDGGDELDEWKEAIAELASEAIEGDLADELADFLQDLKKDMDEASEEFRAEVAVEFTKYVHALAASSVAGAIAAIVAFAVGLITIFANSGASDDIYPIQTVSLSLETNDAAGLLDGSAGSIQASKEVASGKPFAGSEADGRFETNEVEIDLVDPGSAEEAGLGGTVRVGLSWEFTDKTTMSF